MEVLLQSYNTVLQPTIKSCCFLVVLWTNFPKGFHYLMCKKLLFVKYKNKHVKNGDEPTFRSLQDAIVKVTFIVRIMNSASINDCHTFT